MRLKLCFAHKCWEEKFHLSSCNEWCSVMGGYHHEKNQRREGGYGSENMREALQETMDLIKTPVGLEEENLKGDEDVKKKI